MFCMVGWSIHSVLLQRLPAIQAASNIIVHMWGLLRARGSSHMNQSMWGLLCSIPTHSCLCSCLCSTNPIDCSMCAKLRFGWFCCHVGQVATAPPACHLCVANRIIRSSCDKLLQYPISLYHPGCAGVACGSFSWSLLSTVRADCGKLQLQQAVVSCPQSALHTVLLCGQSCIDRSIHTGMAAM